MYRLIVVLCLLCLVAMAVPPCSAGDNLEKGKALFEAGDHPGAKAALEAVLEEDAGNHEAMSYLGRIALAEDDLDGAIDILDRAAELDDSNSVYRTWLGRAYIMKLQTVSYFEKGILAGRAQDQLKKAVSLDPSNVPARIYLAQYYLNAPSIAGGSVKKAREQAEEILKHDPVEGNALMAGIHVKDEEYDLAIEKYEACIEAQPERLEHRYQLGMLYQQTKDFDKCFATLEELLKLEAGAAGALYQIGRTAALSETNLDRGIECLQAYLKTELEPGYPGYDGAHWRLGMLYEHKGDLDEARKEYAKAVEINPDSEQYRDSLASLDNR